MALNDYSFLQTSSIGSYPQVGSSAISGPHFAFLIVPVGGNPEDFPVIAADDFSIGNAAENPAGSNMWFGGNVDAVVEKVEFVDQGTPYDQFNTVQARVYIVAGSIMPNSDLKVLVDVDYTAPTYGDSEEDRGTGTGRPMCLNIHPASGTLNCDGSGGNNPAFVGITHFIISSSYLIGSSNLPDGSAGNQFCSGFNHYRYKGVVPEGRPTLICTVICKADHNNGYFFPGNGVIPITDFNTQGLDFTSNYVVNNLYVRDAENKIIEHHMEFWYTPPQPAIEDMSGNDTENIEKFCNLEHYITFSNFTPALSEPSTNGSQQMIQLLNLNGQTGFGSATNAEAGPLPLSPTGELRSIYVYGSDFAGYDLSVKQVTGSTTKTLAFASSHPASGLESSNSFTSSTTSTGVRQINIHATDNGRATYYPDGRPYAIDYARSVSSSSKDYNVPVAYQEYIVYFPPVSATTYYDIYVVSSNANETGNSDSAKENVTTGYGISGAGSGKTASFPIRVYQYSDPSITIQPSTNVASHYDAMPTEVTKDTFRANVQFKGTQTGEVGSSGHVPFSFAIGASSSKTLSLSRQPVPKDFEVSSGGNGLGIFYETLLAEVSGEGNNNTVTVTGIAYISQTPVDDTVINLRTQNFISTE